MRDIVTEFFAEYPVAVCAELVRRAGELLDQHFINDVLRLGLGASEDIEINHHPEGTGRLRRIPQRRERGVGRDERLKSQTDREKTRRAKVQLPRVVLFQRYAQERAKVEAFR
ncbi:hypothetical protein [Mycetocola reblochoni]|uniref:hypothetical protein n=1 Tax=Microbacteriaceae TaxID=85023 RepID=UPI0011C3CF08|nr:hypothetical protein [Mycetocola reblochoni]